MKWICFAISWSEATVLVKLKRWPNEKLISKNRFNSSWWEHNCFIQFHRLSVHYKVCMCICVWVWLCVLVWKHHFFFFGCCGSNCDFDISLLLLEFVIKSGISLWNLMHARPTLIHCCIENGKSFWYSLIFFSSPVVRWISSASEGSSHQIKLYLLADA